MHLNCTADCIALFNVQRSAYCRFGIRSSRSGISADQRDRHAHVSSPRGRRYAGERCGPVKRVVFDPIESRDTYMLRHLDDIETQRSVPFPASMPD
jgi:hypothetical protein